MKILVFGVFTNCSLQKKNWDASLIALAGVLYLDFLFSRHTEIPKWQWMFFAAHTVNFSIVVIVLIVLFLQTHPVPGVCYLHYLFD